MKENPFYNTVKNRITKQPFFILKKKKKIVNKNKICLSKFNFVSKTLKSLSFQREMGEMEAVRGIGSEMGGNGVGDAREVERTASTSI